MTLLGSKNMTNVEEITNYRRKKLKEIFKVLKQMRITNKQKT